MLWVAAALGTVGWFGDVTLAGDVACAGAFCAWDSQDREAQGKTQGGG
jgi:hypothetical protein